MATPPHERHTAQKLEVAKTIYRELKALGAIEDVTNGGCEQLSLVAQLR